MFIAAVIAGGVYLVFGPKEAEESTGTKKAKKVRSSAPPQKFEKPVEADMSWIPEHHLQNESQGKAAKRKGSKKK